MKRIDLMMAANVQTALATKVQELSTGFRKKQADYLRREFGRVTLLRRFNLVESELAILTGVPVTQSSKATSRARSSDKQSQPTTRSSRSQTTNRL